MALARRAALQAVALAAEGGWQLALAAPACSALQQVVAANVAAGRAGAGLAWRSQPASLYSSAPCSAAGSFGWAAGVRWHSSKPRLPLDGEKQQQPAARNVIESFIRAGWSRQEVLNVPNGLSMLRLLSGPVIAAWILQGQWHLALPVLAVSGATDWADGYVAKNYNQRSVLGSYLDPLADKTLVCSVIAALGYTGVLSVPMVALILGRDVLLVAGAFAARAKSLGWRWPGAGEFFRLQPAQPPLPPRQHSAVEQLVELRPVEQQEAQEQQQQQQQQQQLEQEPLDQGIKEGAGQAPAAPFVEPLYISKVNTCFQLVLAGACMSRAWLGWPGDDLVWWVAASTAGTTVWSCAAYARAYMAGNLLTAGK